jgi:hypothetical protein
MMPGRALFQKSGQPIVFSSGHALSVSGQPAGLGKALSCPRGPAGLARNSHLAFPIDPERSLIMKKTLLILALVTLALVALLGGVFAQKKPDIVGTWVGYAIVGDGSRVDITAVIEKNAAGYTGKLSDTAGMVPESPLKNMVFKEKKLTFEFDLAQGAESTLIKIELTLENEVLKGAWFDPEGNTDLVELTLKK